MQPRDAGSHFWYDKDDHCLVHAISVGINLSSAGTLVRLPDVDRIRSVDENITFFQCRSNIIIHWLKNLRLICRPQWLLAQPRLFACSFLLGVLHLLKLNAKVG